MAQGIILAAGHSSRAQTNKMLLAYKGKPLLCHALEGMLPFVSHVFVVTGKLHHDIEKVVRDIPNVTVVYNERYEEGMFSSVLAGVTRVSDDFFILPGDCPLVGPETYKKLLNGKKPLRVPAYLGTTGHPLFLKAELKSELLAEPRSSNLKVFRDRHDYEVIQTKDLQILTDIDTIEDYNAFIDQLGKELKHGN